MAIVASFQAESSVPIDMAYPIRPDAEVITPGVGGGGGGTYDMIDRVRDRYGIGVQVVSPDAADLQEMVGSHGANLFLRSVEMRRLCCDVRKSRPLARALAGYDAWVTGLRRQQAPTRAQTAVVAADPEHTGLTKGAPPASRTHDPVRDYIPENDLPYHSLYDSRYNSIGCEPRTRATTARAAEPPGRRCR